MKRPMSMPGCVVALSVLLACAAIHASSAQAEEGVTSETIRIGMFGPLTGPVSMYGHPINDGAIAVYQAVNDAGGINGRKIEIVEEDDACDPAKARAAVKKMISRDNVFAIHGGSCSGATFATRDMLIDEKVPFMVMAATLDKISTPVNRYIYTTTPPGTSDGAEIVRFIRSMPNVKRVGIVRHTDEWANAKMEAITASLDQSGLTLVANEVLDRNATDATTQVLHLKDAKPDVVIFVTYPGESAVFLRDARKFGLHAPFIGTNGVMDLLDLAQRAGGTDMVKDVYASAFLAGPVGSPAMQAPAALLKKYFPDDRPQSLSFYGMSGAYAIVDALRRAGPALTRDKFLDALESTTDLPAGPAFCKINITPENHRGCLGQQMWTVRDGKIIALGETWPATMPNE
jgi:branched-chain amino acid transport system substrate-binding protein